jgi:putative peptide zinc metalloprotease protein
VACVGPLHDTAFAQQQWLVRRGERFVQVSELLYRVVELCDGAHDLVDIARRLSASTRWQVTADDVALIVERKLAPLGLVGDGDSDEPVPNTAVSPTLNARLRVLGPRTIERVAGILQYAFHPAAVTVAALLVVTSQIWLFVRGDPGAALQAVASAPLSLPIIAALLVGAGIIHEFGHASALRYGGGRARGMGFGLYVVIPIFYTDVTDSYRLKRSSRIRTDLGGIYFHLLSAAVLIGGFIVTGSDLLLAAAFFIDLDIARQLVPLIRLDGYWALADLTGIPDPLGYTRERLLRRLGAPPPTAAPPPLRPRVHRIVASYMAVSLPATAALMAYVFWHAPAVVQAGGAKLHARAELLREAIERHHVGQAVASVVDIALLGLPILALVAFAAVLTRAVTLLVARRWTAGSLRPRPRTGAGRSGLGTRRKGRRGQRAAVVREDADRISLADAIAEHLALKALHEEQDRLAARQRSPAYAAMD